MKRLFDRLWVVDGVLFLLITIGLLNLYSTAYTEPLTLDNVVVRQALFVVIGFVIYVGISLLDYNLSRTVVLQSIAVGATVLLLTGLFFLASDVNETRRWYRLGEFLFQPSEYAKVVVIFWTAFWLATESWVMKIRLLAIAGVVGVLAVLILMEPDLGTTIITLFIVSVMVSVRFYRERIFQMIASSTIVYGLLAGYLVGTRLLHLLPWSWGIVVVLVLVAIVFTVYVLLRASRYALFAGLSAGAVCGLILLGIIAWNFILRDYQRLRFTSFFNKSQAEASFQVEQAKIAIGSGQWFGKGLGQGTQSRLRYLPESQTDFMFAAYVEEWGFVGGILLIGLYLVLLIRFTFVALTAGDGYAQLLILGLASKLWIEVFINLSMNMGLIPTKGIPLPFVSYGGSAILSGFIILGIMQSVYRFSHKKAVTTTTQFSLD